MKIAILTDIHAQFIALQTVAAHLEAWRPDAVFVAGDTVNRGPRPMECLRFVQDKARTMNWQIVRGNHEDYVISHAQPRIWTDRDRELNSLSLWTYHQLNGQVAELEAMPSHISMSDPMGDEVRVTHASMCGIRHGIYPESSDEELPEKIAPPPRVLGVGHTHRPLIRQFNDTLIVNAGSAGLPFDGDRRISYAQLVWQKGQWQAEIMRLDYDYQAAEKDFYETGYILEAGPLVKLVLYEFHYARGRLASWSQTYDKRIAAGEITMSASVDEFLAKFM